MACSLWISKIRNNQYHAERSLYLGHTQKQAASYLEVETKHEVQGPVLFFSIPPDLILPLCPWRQTETEVDSWLGGPLAWPQPDECCQLGCSLPEASDSRWKGRAGAVGSLL